MLSVVIAVASALLVGAALAPFFGFGAILPGIVVLVLVYLYIVRRTNAALQGGMQNVQAAILKKNIDGALVELEKMREKYGRWVLFLASQLDGQIGGIHYLKRDFDKAEPYLERAFLRMWESKLMAAVLASGQVGKQKPNMAKVDDLLEKASRVAPKQGLLWSTWAYLHWKAGDAKKAIDVLGRGQAALGDADPTLSQNLLALQNDKKMKMKGYGDAWYQLQLEQHPMVMQAQRGGNVRFARR